MHGPNVRRLIALRMSSLTVPPGGGFADAMAVLRSRERLAAIAREATDWVEEALAVVKTCPDNTYGDDDEAIAARILEEFAEHRRRHRPT